MGRRIACILLVAFLANITGCRDSYENGTVSEPPAQTALPYSSHTYLLESDLSSLDRILREALPSLGGGAALILISKDQIIYRKAFGNYQLDRVLPIASATKWLSGAVMLSLVDEGKLALDDPVARYMPDFADQKAGITIRHLFAHTSGLPPEAPCRNNRSTTLEDCARAMGRLSLQANPGEAFHYGGVSMHVGGRVAEVVTGKPWNDIFMEKIAEPLGMQHTDYHAYGPTRNPRPAGDARSSLDEYGRFLQMLLNRGVFEGNRILSEAAVAELHRDQTAGASISYSIFWNKGHLDPGLPEARYGVGVWLEKQEGDSGTALEASSPGALGAYPWIDFSNNIAGLLLTRSSFSPSLPVYLRIKEEYQRKLRDD